MEDLSARIASLEANRVRDAARIRLLEKWYDTLNTPWYKRVFFVLQGYRLTRLGTWYKATWNSSGWQYNPKEK